jgi:hypothetical protein
MRAAPSSSLSLSTTCAALLALTAVPVALRAQGAASPALSPAWAPAYDERFQQLQELDGGSTGSAEVTRLVLRRDAAELTLEGGRLYLLPAVGGRTVAVAYECRGTFTFKPRHPVERRQLLRTHKTEALSTPIRQVVLLFSDSTLAELSRSVTFTPGQQLPGALQRRVREMVDYFSDPESKSPDADVMGDLLNASASNLFYAHVARESGDPLMFMINPYEVESVRLLGRARQVGWVRVTDVVSQARPEGDSAASDTERWAQAEVVRYVLDVALPRTNSGEVRFAASAKMDIVARQTVGPWIAFALYQKLQVDSARWADGTPATAYKRKDAPEMWLRADRALAPGETRSVTVYTVISSTASPISFSSSRRSPGIRWRSKGARRRSSISPSTPRAPSCWRASVSAPIRSRSKAA